MNQTLTEFYLQIVTQFLTTPAGMAAIFVGMLLALVAITVPGSRWVYVCLAMYAATLPINAIGYHPGDIYVPLAFPLEQIRVYARPLTLAFMVLMLLPLVTSRRVPGRRLVGGPLTMLFVFQMAVSVRLMAVDPTGRGLLTALSFPLLMLTFGIGVSLWVRTIDDVYKLLYAFSAATALVIVATCYQLAINRTPIMHGGRLSGVTGNPQFLGIIIAFTLPTACFLMLQGRRVWRPFMGVMIAVMVLLLMWTGSRTGLIGSVLGVGTMFYRRLGRLLLVSVVVAVPVYLAAPLFEGSAANAERFFSTLNTRSGAWNAMIESFKSAPLFGVSTGDFGGGESSYLAVLSQVGIITAIPFAIAWLMTAYHGLRLQLQGAWLGEHRAMADLVCAFWVTVAVTALFEVFLLGTLTFPMLAVYLFADLGTVLEDHIAAEQQASLLPAQTLDPFLIAA